MIREVTVAANARGLTRGLDVELLSNAVNGIARLDDIRRADNCMISEYKFGKYIMKFLAGQRVANFV